MKSKTRKISRPSVRRREPCEDYEGDLKTGDFTKDNIKKEVDLFVRTKSQY